MPTFTHQGLTLHYRDQGQGPAVLLLHAFPLSGAVWDAQLAALSQRYRVVVPDLRGFGASPVGPGVAEMRTFAEDAIALLDHLGIDAAVVGGVSMGGYVAMALLQQDPSRVRALILSDTTLRADDEVARQKREDTIRTIETRGMEGLAEYSLPKLLAQPPAPEVERTVRDLILQNPPEGAIAATRGMAARPNSRDILARFAGPALIVVGAQDAVTPRDRAEEMANVLSRSKVVEIPRAGHLPPIEAPEAFNDVVEAFLREL